MTEGQNGSQEESVSKKVVRNTTYNYIGLLFNIVVRLLVTPFIVHRLENDAYGVMSIVGVIIGYAGLMELGIGTSLQKFIAEYEAKRDYGAINRIISTAFIMYICLAVVGCIAIIALTNFFVTSVFDIPMELRDISRVVFIISAFAFSSSFVLGIFGNIVVGLQRHDIFNKVLIGASLVLNAGSVVILWLGYRLIPLVAYQAGASLLGMVVMGVLAKRLMPQLSMLPRYFDRDSMKRIANFSFAVFINQISVRFMGSLDKLIVGIFLPIANVTIYSIGVTVMMIVFRIPAVASSAMTPASSELDARDRHGAIQEMVLRGMKYTVCFACPLFVAVGVLAQTLIRLWMGPGYAESAAVLQILSFGFFMLVAASAGAQVMIGINRPYINTIYASAQILLNVILSPLLVWKYGMFGAAYGTTITFIVGSTIFILHTLRILEIPAGRVFNSKFLRAGSVLAMLSAGLFLVNRARPAVDFITMFAYAAVYGTLCLLYIIRYLVDDRDVEILSRVIPPVRRLDGLRKRGKSDG